MKAFAKITVACAFALIVPFASATPVLITSGTTVVTYPLGAQASVINDGTVASTGTMNLTAPTFTATAIETVFKDGGNVFCSDCLTFEFQFTDIAGSPNAIEHFTAGSFTGYSTAVGYLTGTGTANQLPIASTTDAAPITVDESLGGVLSFNFSATAITPVVGIQPGNTSDDFFVETNATTYVTGNAAVIDSTSANMVIYVPGVVTSTPEPSSLVLLGSGLVGAAGMMVRRRRIA